IAIDLDGDGGPQIVFGPQAASGTEHLVAIRGKDCSQHYDVDAGLQGFSQIAAADLDGDKLPEIVGIMGGGAQGSGHQIAIFDGKTGTKLATSAAPYQSSGAGFD